MRIAATLALVVANALVATTVHGGGTSFNSITGAASANDMTPDGRFVVGSLVGGGAYIWDRVLDTMTTLPEPAYQAVAVSDDGSVILGNIIDPKSGDDLAAIWTASSGVWTSLGSLPSGLACPSRSTAYELSADGTVAVGLAWVNGCDGVGFRWTQAGGMVALESLANGGNRASVVDATGNLIGGFAQGSFSRTPAIWSGDGTGQLLDPPNGDAVGEVYAINPSGSVVLGSWNGQAVKWTDGATMMTVLGQGSILPGWTGIPLGIATNGTTVGFDILFGNRRAWLQLGGDGALIDLKSFLEAQEVEVPIGLEVCQAITSDGTTIVGHGGFFNEAWIVTIETPSICTGDLSGDNVVDGADLGVLLNQWGGGGSADLTGDGVVDGADLGVLLNNWGVCEQVPGACCLGAGCAQLTAAECAALGGSFLGQATPCTPAVCNANDFCANATDITSFIDGVPILADNSLATPPFGGGDPELPEGTPTCHWSGEPQAAHSTIWYRFEAPEAGFVFISLCGSSETTIVDSTIALFSGSCGTLVEEACDEDSCPEGPFLSEMLAIVNPGETYYLCIMNPGAWTGSTPGAFSFTITTGL